MARPEPLLPFAVNCQYGTPIPGRAGSRLGYDSLFIVNARARSDTGSLDFHLLYGVGHEPRVSPWRRDRDPLDKADA